MGSFAPISKAANLAAKATVEAALRVHSAPGPGLLESVYVACLIEELGAMGHTVRTQVPVPLEYRSVKLEVGFRLDLLVDERLIVEVKAVDALHPVFEAQLLTYMKLSGHRLGLLLNFNVPLMKDGIRRLVH